MWVWDLKVLEETIKGSIFAVAGDNLGAHLLTEMPQNFSTSTNICRYCYTSSKNLKENDFSLKKPRTQQSHENDVVHGTGWIEYNSLLNEI